ncbi:MAG: UDP-4-amino-4,6-dideoxy-N-acetyl-beta-L-altrosamine transaminase [Patescibacteria group bacterium]
MRAKLLPYARQSVREEDIAAVTDVLRSDWLTTGPNVAEFEREFAAATGAREAVAVSNGTAALHTALHGIDIRPGDEVVVPAMTFAATANAALFRGAKPVFADVDATTLLIDPEDAEKRITEKTRAIIAVDYAGQPCDYQSLQTLARRRKLRLVADACHALGGAYRGRPAGSLADCSTFSFHPVKPLATGEGGMITTDAADMATRMRQFRNHCMTNDHRERQERGAWFYEITDLGYNYRLTDIQCALGRSQLRSVPAWTERRRELAARYDGALAGMNGAAPLSVRDDAEHAYHLYVIRLDLARLSADRNQIYQAMRAENIGVNVHYIPVHLHPFYRTALGTKPGLCPVAEAAYERILSLPLFAGMTDQDARDVITALEKVLSHYSA